MTKGYFEHSPEHSIAALTGRYGGAKRHQHKIKAPIYVPPRELAVRYDSRKSFYGKAKEREEDGKIILTSYGTDVAYIKGGKPVVKGMYSQTTARHIREFLKQHGYDADMPFSKILKQYGESETEQKEEQKEEEKKADSQLNTVANVALLGEIFGSTQKEKNDWKARMLKAGLENKGLEMPEDWDALSEAEKQRRLDGVIKIMKEKK
jgi:hypothetical protein